MARPCSFSWLLLALTCCRPAVAKKQQLWPEEWAVLGQQAADQPLGGWTDPVEARHGAGVHEVWDRLTSSLAAAKLRKVQPDAEGNVALPLRAGEEAWLVGRVKAQKLMCFSVTLTGSVLQAFLGQRILPPGWPLQLQLPKGPATAFVRLHGSGRFRFKLAPCVPKLKVLEDSAESAPPDIAGGVVGDVVHVRAHNAGERWLHGIVLQMLAGADGIGAAEPVSLAPGQAAPVSRRLRLPSGAASCPLRLQMRLEVSGLEQAVNVTKHLQCRNASREGYIFTYLDADGSPQAAGVRAPTKPCPAAGCPVILSLHGMDVPASRQAYAYNAREDAWLLAPHGRSAFAGLNWQNSGHRSAWAALAALKEHSRLFEAGSRLADVSKVVFTGHSNGGFAALLLAAQAPDLALCVAPLAGMLRLNHGPPATSAPRRLQTVLDASLAAYELDRVAGNVAGIPCLARTGAMDEVIPPSSTRQLAAAVEQGGGQCRVVEVPGKGHWWWDSRAANDGGAVDDAEMSGFFKSCFQKGLPGLPETFTHRCASLDVCGSRGGLRMLRQEEPFSLSSFKVTSKDGQPWEVQTKNVLLLAWSGTSPLQVLSAGMRLDGREFRPEELQAATSACRRPGSSKWQLCPRAKCCSAGRMPEQAAPLRSLFVEPLTAVVGTGGGFLEPHVDAARALANSHFAVAGGTMAIAMDNETLLPDRDLLLLGGPAQNSQSAALLQRGALPDLRLDDPSGVGIGPCNWTNPSWGLLAVGPMPGGASGRFTLMAATSAAALGKLVAAFGGLFETNVWQARLPDYLLVEAEGGTAGAGGVLAAGFWGGASGWEWTEGSSHLDCGKGRAGGRQGSRKAGRKEEL